MNPPVLPPSMFIGPLVHSISLNNLEFIEDGIIIVSNGKIEFLQQNSNNAADIQNRYGVKNENVIRLAKGQFLIPGFIDTHIHGPQYPNIGLGYDMPLLEWLGTYTFPLETKFCDESFAKKVYAAVVKKTLANGTTTACYYATIHKRGSIILAETAKNLGQRAFIGKVNMNKNTPKDYGETFEESVAETKAFIESILALNDPLIKPIITPRFALSCDMPLMKVLAQMAINFNIPIQTHVSENVDEIKQVEKEYPDCKNYVDVYDKAGLISNKTILAHGIYLNSEELSVIKEKGAKISHCASSNTLLKSGNCPVRNYLDAGIQLCLGTDCSGGSSCSILDALRQSLQLSIHLSFDNKGKALSVEELFYLATLGGAEAVDLQNETGNFTVGKYFDSILVDLNETAALDLLENYNLKQFFQKFIYLGDDRVMKKVFVAGKVVKQL